MMTKWFHNPGSGQTFDLAVDDVAGIAAAKKNGAIEIPDPTGEGMDDDADKNPDNSPDTPPDNGGKPSRKKNGAAKDDGSE